MTKMKEYVKIEAWKVMQEAESYPAITFRSNTTQPKYPMDNESAIVLQKISS